MLWPPYTPTRRQVNAPLLREVHAAGEGLEAGIGAQPAARPRLFQLGVLGHSLLEDRDVGVGVFPQFKELLVSLAPFLRIACKGVGSLS